MPEIEFEAVEDGVGVITLNRPEKRNAFNFGMHRQLGEILTSGELQDLRAVILQGAGQAFCAGTDLSELGDQLSRGSATFEVSTGGELSANFRQARPVIIAAVQGYALGLGTLVAMLADLVVAGDDARFGHPEVTHGLAQGNGIPRLLEVVGMRNAMSLLVTGRRVAADEALRMGMINEIVPTADLSGRALEVARQVAANPTFAVHLNKRFLYEAAEMPFAVAVQAGYRVMRTAQLARREQNGAAFTW